ncbi:alpha/beta hydrolase, partial [Acinetobacter baumannii]
LDGERAFLALCFNSKPDEATFSRLLANAALASWPMQKAVQSMSVFAEQGLSRARIPLLFLYGGKDALVRTEPAIARARQL